MEAASAVTARSSKNQYLTWQFCTKHSKHHDKLVASESERDFIGQSSRSIGEATGD